MMTWQTIAIGLAAWVALGVAVAAGPWMGGLTVLVFVAGFGVGRRDALEQAAPAELERLRVLLRRAERRLAAMVPPE